MQALGARDVARSDGRVAARDLSAWMSFDSATAIRAAGSEPLRHDVGVTTTHTGYSIGPFPLVGFGNTVRPQRTLPPPRCGFAGRPVRSRLPRARSRGRRRVRRARAGPARPRREEDPDLSG